MQIWKRIIREPVEQKPRIEFTVINNNHFCDQYSAINDVLSRFNYPNYILNKLW